MQNKYEEITEKEAQLRREVEINKYVRLCPSCYFYSNKYKCCDMCDYGGLTAINNHGLKPSEVQRCDVYCNKQEAIK